MSKKADYQLEHQLFGRQGSMWERQVDDETRTQVRAIVKAAGSSSVLTQLDAVATGAVGGGDTLIQDGYFDFSDGDFAVVGQNLQDYDHALGTTDAGTPYYVAFRGTSTAYDSDPIPTDLARVTNEFLHYINTDPYQLATDRDWYLVPVPDNLTPIVIQGRGEDEFLVSGIDFIARRGYIALTDSPAEVLPSGLVRVPSAYLEVFSPNSFVLSSPVSQSNKWAAEYAYKTQSLEAFKRAAAEYAGLYVFDEPDVILGIVTVDPETTVYLAASAGPIVIGYKHQALDHYQKVEPGYIISDGFEVVASRYGETANLKETAAAGWTDPVSMDGILPVNGLSWQVNTTVTVDSEANDPTSGTPHLRLNFDGDAVVQRRWWEFCRLHEQETQVFLYDALSPSSVPFELDLWDFLETYYGIQLVLVLAEDHNPTIDSRLRRFVDEFHPASCTIIASLKTVLPAGGALEDDDGHPIVGEDGEYIGAEDSLSERVGITVYGNVLSHTSLPLTHESGDSEEDAVLFDTDEMVYDTDNPIVYSS